MPSIFHLTDEPALIAGYLRATLGERSANPSLVRAVTDTQAGAPAAGIQITRSAGGTALAWITDPLGNTGLTAAAWQFHVWARESSLAANAALRFQVLPYTTSEQAAALDDNGGTELTTTIADYARTSAAATLTSMNAGDRLVFKVLVDDAGTLAVDHTVTVSYNGQHPRAEGDSYVVAPDNLAVTETVPYDTLLDIRAVLQQSEVADAPFTNGQLERAWQLAVGTYSQDKPRLVADSLSGDGTAYDFSLPRQWVHGLSLIQSIEHPADQQRPTFVDPELYLVHETVLGVQPVRRLRFLSGTPESGADNIIVRYTTRHVHSDEGTTIPSHDLDALAWLAASYAAETRSAFKADGMDSTLAADSVDQTAGVDLWGRVARRLRSLYREHIGIGGPVMAAGRTYDLDQRPFYRDYFWHGGRTR